MNQLGSYRRLELALGAPLDEIAERIGDLLELQVPSGLVGKVKALGQLKELASFAPKIVKKAAFREVVVDPPDLARLPVLTTWPGDGGPFITLPVVVTKDRQGRRNAGMYRLQVFDGRTTGMHWHVHHDGAANFREADGRLEVAVALGTDPADHLRRHGAAAAGHRRVHVRRLPARRAGRAGALRDRRPRGAGRRRDRPRGLRRAGRDAPRGPVRRPHRLLLARRRVPGLPPHGHDPSPRPRSTRRPSSAGRRWRTPTSARPPSASSCRCSSWCSPRSSTWTCRSRASSTTARSSPSARSIPARRARS